jgi:rSAM/selenodomain-associated transferase 1
VSSNRIVIFSKSADPDSVKTRMRPTLTSEQCLTLHLALLKDTIDKVRDMSSVLYLSGSGFLPFESGMQVRMQTGNDLGERMLYAFAEELERFSKVIIIGIDSPTLPPEEIVRAFDVLENHEVVLGPSDDGGYYLVGLNKLIHEMFQEIRWGTSEVLFQTLQKIKGHRHLLLNTYFDVDWPQDLTRLRAELEQEDGMSLENVRSWVCRYFGASAR